MSTTQILSSYRYVDKQFLNTLTPTFNTSTLIDFVFKVMPNCSKHAQGGKLIATTNHNIYTFQIYEGFVSVEYIVNGETEIKLYEI